MSTPDQTFSTLNETKDFLNIARSNDDSNEKINTNRNSADNYVANQIRLHANIPISDADPELSSLASQLAAAYFNQFQNPMKTEMMELVKTVKQSIQDYIMETYGRKNPSGLAGDATFGITKPITGFTSSTTPSDDSSTQVTGIESINADTTSAQIIAAGTGLGIVDSGATHTLSIDSTVVTLNATQILTDKTLTTPTIGDFTNANHDHEASTGGGQLTATDALDATGTTDSTTFLRGDNTWSIPTSSGITTLNLDTTIVQTLSGTSNRITVIDTTPDHAFDISANYVGQTSITTLGTITIGIWNGTDIALGNIANGTSNQIIKTNAGGTALEFGLIGDANTATFTTTKISTTNKSLLNSAIVYNDQANSFGDFAQTFTDDKLFIQNPLSTATYQIIADAITSNRTFTFPLLTTNDTFVAEDFTQTLANKTLTTPTIGDFTNANHDHEASTGGGQLTATDALDATGTTDSTTFLRGDNTWNTPDPGIVSINSDIAAAQTLTGGDGIDIIDSTPDHSFAVDGTVARSTDNLGFFAATSSAQLAGVINDETGTGLLVFNSSPTIITPTIASFVNATHDHSNAIAGGQLTNSALTSGVFAAITGIGTQTQTLDIGNNQIINVTTLNTDNVTISNQGAGTDPVLSSNDAAQTLDLVGNFELSAGYIDMQEITVPGNPATDTGRFYELDYGGISTPFHKDSAGTISNVLTGQAKNLFTVHNQAQLEAELGSNLTIPDNTRIGIIIGDTFSITKPFLIGENSSLEISGPVPATPLNYTGTGAMFQNLDPVKPIDVLILHDIVLNGDTTNNAFDLLITSALVMNGVRCDNFLDIGTISSPIGIDIRDSFFFNDARGFKLINAGVISFKSVGTAPLTANDLTFVTVLSDTPATTNVTLDSVRLLSGFAGDAMLFADPNTPTSGNSYTLQNSIALNGVLYQQGTDIAINSIADNGSGKTRYTTASPHGLVLQQAVVKSGFATETVLNATSLTTAIPTPTTFDTDEDFNSTDTGSMTEQSLEQDDVIVDAFNNPGSPNSMTIVEERTNGTTLQVNGAVSTAVPIVDVTPVVNDFVQDIATEEYTVNTTTGEITYIGLSDITTIIEFQFNAATTSGPDQTVEFDLRINDVQQVKTASTIIVTTTAVSVIYTGGIFTLSSNDTLRLFRNNTTNTNDTDITNLKLLSQRSG